MVGIGVADVAANLAGVFVSLADLFRPLSVVFAEADFQSGSIRLI